MPLTRVGLSLLVLLALCGGLGCTPLQCQPPPEWTINGVDIMAENRGHVTLVALFAASWDFCLIQARRLEILRQAYVEQLQITDIKFLTVNHKGPISQARYGLLASRTNFTTYQDTEEDDVWSKLDGRKDDFFIYDRCGRLTYFVGLPHSNLAHNVTERAITSTYYDHPCGPCSTETLDNQDGHAEPESAQTAPQEVGYSFEGQHHKNDGHHHMNGGHHEMNGGETVSQIETVPIQAVSDSDSPGFFAHQLRALKRFFTGSSSQQTTEWQQVGRTKRSYRPTGGSWQPSSDQTQNGGDQDQNGGQNVQQ